MSEKGMINATSPFFIADWRVDPASCRISRGRDGHIVEHKIEPKAMTVLVCLAQQQGQVVSREVLEETAWQGMVVGYDSLASAIIKLRKAFGDSSKNSEIIETVPKRGYRLICPVSLEAPASERHSAPAQNQDPVETSRTNIDQPGEVENAVQHEPALSEEQKQKADGDGKTGRRKGNFGFNFMLAVMVMVLAGLFTLFFINPPPETVTQKDHRLVIAILPFKNLSDDPRQDYFSDGITVDLITDLSKIEDLSVIARNSVFVYKNSDADIKTIHEELGVDYIVEGSVRKRGNKLRIAAQLIDASNSINVWAERFDGDLNNVFAFQDTVTSKIISEDYQRPFHQPDRAGQKPAGR
jgi:TolB-like protein/DNA-binding winged helix-turn-helix (wHTH) protein